MAEDIRGLPSREYWEKRALLLDKKLYKNEAEYEKKLMKVYESQISEMSQKVESFIFKYAKENKLSLQDAEQILTGVELGEYRSRMESLMRDYKATGSEKALEEIELLGKSMSVTRLKGLMNELSVMLGAISVETQLSLDVLLAESYKEAFYMSAFNVAVGMGVAVPIAKVNKDALDKVLKYPLTGKHYSDRIWSNKTKLLEALQEELIRGCVQGTDVRKMAKNLKDKMGVSKFNATRLMRTETAFFIEAGTSKGHQAMGVEKYEIIATLDTRTSKVCQHQDGKTYLYSEERVGVNSPPFHAMCRSTKCVYIEDKEVWQRRARGEDGKTYLIPSNIKYAEWQQKYLK